MIPVKTINYSKNKARPVRNTHTSTVDDMAPRKSEDNVSVWTLSDDDGSSWCCFGGRASKERPTQPEASNATQEKQAYERQQRMAVPQPARLAAPATTTAPSA